MRRTSRVFALLLAIAPIVFAVASEAAPVSPKVGTGSGDPAKPRQAQPEPGKAITVSNEEQKKMLEANVKALQVQSADIARRLEKVWRDLERLEAGARPEARSSAALCIAINSIKLEMASLNAKLDTRSKSELNKDALVLEKSLSLLISEKQKLGIPCEGDS